MDAPITDIMLLFIPKTSCDQVVNSITQNCISVCNKKLLNLKKKCTLLKIHFKSIRKCRIVILNSTAGGSRDVVIRHRSLGQRKLADELNVSRKANVSKRTPDGCRSCLPNEGQTTVC